MLLAAGLLPFICSLFQVSTLSLFHHLIQHTAWSPDALDGRALTGGALTIPLLSLPGVRVLTLPPFDSANGPAWSPDLARRWTVVVMLFVFSFHPRWMSMMLLAVSLHPQWLPVVGAGCGCVGATHSLDDAPGASSERQRLPVMQRQCLMLLAARLLFSFALSLSSN